MTQVELVAWGGLFDVAKNRWTQRRAVVGFVEDHHARVGLRLLVDFDDARPSTLRGTWEVAAVFATEPRRAWEGGEGPILPAWHIKTRRA